MQEIYRQMLLGSLIDQYHIERQLGKGGAGDVFLATDMKLDRKVAIKFMQQNPGVDLNKQQERFFREIKAMVGLNHPNIVQISDYNMNGFEGPYYVMEYLRGQDLEAYLQAEGPLDVVEVYSIAQQLCSALHAIHQQDITYRDLKTPNVFVIPTDTYKHIKLVDFGLALKPDEERMTQKGFIVGTPHFMAPEQIMNTADVTHKADIYAFGVLLFRLLTDDYPHKGKTQIELLRNHCMGNFEIDHPRVRPEMRSLLSELLAKNPDERPSSMLEVWQKLEAVLVKEMQQRQRHDSQPYISAYQSQAEIATVASRDATPINAVVIGSSDAHHDATQQLRGTTSRPLSTSQNTTVEESSFSLEFSDPNWLGQ